LWAALNPGEWVSADEVNQDLTPFWNTDSTFWSSVGLETHNRLNYSYPEFKGLDINDKPGVRDHIDAAVRKLYNFDHSG